MSGDNKITFFSKNKISCPVCEATFYREELHTGRGRLIAGNLTEELRRLYEPSERYGKVFPLIYPPMVCPSCYYAALSADFLGIEDAARRKIDADADNRLRSISLIFDRLDYREPRELEEGMAAYYLAMTCYDHFPEESNPTIKRGICALRAAWIANDLSVGNPGDNFEELAGLLYQKARFFYNLAIEYEQNGTEPIGSIVHLGPDLDKNYGYEGVLYLSGYLDLRHGQRDDPSRRIAALKNAKRTVSRIFGIGKASKSKPSAILDLARKLYDEIGGALSENGEDGES